MCICVPSKHFTGWKGGTDINLSKFIVCVSSAMTISLTRSPLSFPHFISLVACFSKRWQVRRDCTVCSSSDMYMIFCVLNCITKESYFSSCLGKCSPLWFLHRHAWKQFTVHYSDLWKLVSHILITVASSLRQKLVQKATSYCIALNIFFIWRSSPCACSHDIQL